MENFEGIYFEDLKIGMKFKNPIGRTIIETDNVWFTLLTNNLNPIHFDKKYSEKMYPGEPFKGRNIVNGILVLAIAIGLTTQISSRGFMLGIEKAKFYKPVFVGDTIYTESEIIDLRESKSKQGFGIVKIKTKTLNQNNEIVLEFERTIMIPKKGKIWE
jgi:Acyl dehydratase